MSQYFFLAEHIPVVVHPYCRHFTLVSSLQHSFHGPPTVFTSASLLGLGLLSFLATVFD